MDPLGGLQTKHLKLTPPHTTHNKIVPVRSSRTN